MTLAVSKVKIAREDVKGIEARFAVHCGKGRDNGRDLHLIKEVIHLKDGTIIPNIRLKYDYERPFWITKPGFRKTHKSKKEWEDIDRLNQYKSTQSDLGWNISRVLKEHNPRGDLRKALNSPYVYGADILSTALIKRQYRKAFPDTNSPLSVAPLDGEWDVVVGHGEILMLCVSCKEKVFTTVQRSFFKGMIGVEKQLKDAAEKYLGEYIKKRNITWDFELVDSELDVVTRTFEKLHILKPDLVAIWNMNADIPKIIDTLKKHRVNPAQVFSDPAVPDEYKFYYYKPGKDQRITSSGKVQPLKPEEKWHTLFTPASWYVVDAMCIYATIRKAKGKEPSYSLDYTLEKNLGIRKLKFKEADHLVGIDWHKFMQTNYPIEYTIYNGFDCISIEELDEKTKDMAYSFPSQCEESDFQHFTSQPRRRVNELDDYVRQFNKVIGTTGKEMGDEYTPLTIGMTDWIITLPAHLVAQNGLQIIEEYPDLHTNVYSHTGDLDVAASWNRDLWEKSQLNNLFNCWKHF